MAHPIVGIWQVELELEGQLTHVTHAYHPDGIMHLDAGEHGASLLWEATGDRSFRFRGTRPVERDLYRFLGWQYADGEAEVSPDGAMFVGTELTAGPRPDGERVARRATLRGTRLAIE